MRLLIVEDDHQLGPWLRNVLSRDLGNADLVVTLEEAQAAIAVETFDLVVVDRRLPDGDGIELLPELRRLNPKPGILMLTALDNPHEIAQALDAGADDYLGKPFESIELLARSKAVIRRLRQDRTGFIAVANMEFDTANRTLTIDGVAMLVPRRELAVFETLASRAGRVVLREALEAATYGFDDEIQSNAIDAHVSRLRRRLREAGAKATIQSVRGLGYMMSDAS